METKFPWYNNLLISIIKHFGTGECGRAFRELSFDPRITQEIELTCAFRAECLNGHGYPVLTFHGDILRHDLWVIKCFSNFPPSKAVKNQFDDLNVDIFVLPRGINLSAQKGFKNAHDIRTPVHNDWMSLSPLVESRSEFDFWLHGASRYSAVGQMRPPNEVIVKQPAGLKTDPTKPSCCIRASYWNAAFYNAFVGLDDWKWVQLQCDLQFSLRFTMQTVEIRHGKWRSKKTFFAFRCGFVHRDRDIL